MVKKTNVGGRPMERIKTTKIEAAIEPEIKNAFMRKLASEGKRHPPKSACGYENT